LFGMTRNGLSSCGSRLVSVVVPNFNCAEFLDRTMASIADQTHAPIDVIVVDGASTDGSVDVIRQWEDRLPLRWVSEPDSGQPEAINKGISMASGEIVGWINSDDMLTPNSAAWAVERFAANPELDFIWGFCLVVDENDRSLNILNPFVRQDLGLLHRHRNFVPQPGSWFSRRLFTQYGPLSEELHFLFDYDFFLRFAGRVHAEFIPEVMAHFRLHSSSKTGSQEARFLREEPQVFRAHGGGWLSPFWLDYLRYRLLQSPADHFKEPMRRVLRKLLGLPKGARIRT